MIEEELFGEIKTYIYLNNRDSKFDCARLAHFLAVSRDYLSICTFSSSRFQHLHKICTVLKRMLGVLEKKGKRREFGMIGIISGFHDPK